MRLRLPFVYETRSVVRAGRLVHGRNVRAEIDVEVDEVPGLEDAILFQHRDYQIARWSDRLYAMWGRGGERRIQARINAGVGDRRKTEPPEFPIPPYMRTARFGIVKNALQAPALPEEQVRINDLPYDVDRRIAAWNARLRESQAEQAREFYRQAVVASDRGLWVQCEEPVWQIARVRNDKLHLLGPRRPAEAYCATLVIAPDFRWAHLQFRLDRLADAWGFAAECFERPVDDGIAGPPYRSTIVHARSDMAALSACVMELLKKDLALPRFFLEPRISERLLFEEAGELLHEVTEADIPLRSVQKLQILRKRWVFERQCLERDERAYHLARVRQNRLRL